MSNQTINTIEKYSVNQLYYSQLNESIGVELMLLLGSDLSHLTNNFSLVSNKNVLVPQAKPMESSEEDIFRYL